MSILTILLDPNSPLCDLEQTPTRLEYNVGQDAVLELEDDRIWLWDGGDRIGFILIEDIRAIFIVPDLETSPSAQSDTGLTSEEYGSPSSEESSSCSCEDCQCSQDISTEEDPSEVLSEPESPVDPVEAPSLPVEPVSPLPQPQPYQFPEAMSVNNNPSIPDITVTTETMNDGNGGKVVVQQINHKPGRKTTEFWVTILTVLGTAGAAISGFVTDSFKDHPWAIGVAGAVTVIASISYVVARALVKLKAKDLLTPEEVGAP